ILTPPCGSGDISTHMVQQFQDIVAPHGWVVEFVGASVAMRQITAPANLALGAGPARGCQRDTFMHRLVYERQSETQVVDIILQHVHPTTPQTARAYP